MPMHKACSMARFLLRSSVDGAPQIASDPKPRRRCLPSATHRSAKLAPRSPPSQPRHLHRASDPSCLRKKYVNHKNQCLKVTVTLHQR
ncbi:hypothetical protein IQ07DRAFT_219184 [Pyrenochaeta sp. DS3sAY3a]|nr:hypothetical protein IQ07DRAFT_219184 [Pyrenochaeta sp. DS3sAY3a]